LLEADLQKLQEERASAEQSCIDWQGRLDLKRGEIAKAAGEKGCLLDAVAGLQADLGTGKKVQEEEEEAIAQQRLENEDLEKELLALKQKAEETMLRVRALRREAREQEEELASARQKALAAAGGDKLRIAADPPTGTSTGIPTSMQQQQQHSSSSSSRAIQQLQQPEYVPSHGAPAPAGGGVHIQGYGRVAHPPWHLSSAADDSGASDGGASLDPEGAGIMLPEMSNLLDCAPLLVADEPSNDVSKWLENMDLQI